MGQYSFICFDEATDFSEIMVNYLLSRMRNAHVDYEPQMFLMTNPDYDSFLRTWIQDYYLDKEGNPLEEKAGHKRYFVRQGDNILWANTKEELEAIYGIGDDNGISSFCFIPARCTDNPPLLKAQPSYLSRLLSLSEVEVKRLYYGNWFVRPEAAGHWKADWITKVDYPNYQAKQRVRAYDIASSPPSSAFPDPDWTRGVLMSKDTNSQYTIEDVVSIRDRTHRVEELIFNTARMDGDGVTVVLPSDVGAQAGAYARSLQRRLGEMGINCRLVRPNKSKLARFAPFSSVSQAGFVSMCRADWNKEFCDELEAFNGGQQRGHDDMVDCCSDAFYILNQSIHIPDFTLPDLTGSNSFSSIQ